MIILLLRETIRTGSLRRPLETLVSNHLFRAGEKSDRWPKAIPKFMNAPAGIGKGCR
jgi:hypothetical protein